ncbi:MAG TPA: molecular chaperone TorD family protein [Candidatus Sulfotelmatobacter sp.]|jgi:TorA-specific chaperone|nr:molecular chaperone TorD family protein [Candidatus Sulfotelmatobacter sp.]
MAETLSFPMTDEQRAQLYHWLGGLFLQPLNKERIAAHLSGPGAAFLADLEHSPAFRPALTVMTQALRVETCERNLSQAFSLLFLGVGGPATVPPYESAFTDDNGRLFQRATRRMEDELRRLDLSVDASCAEPPDHLAVELMTMAQLIARDDRAEQARFLDRHLSWISDFTELCGRRDRSGFYAAAAQLLTAFIETERLVLNKAGSAILEREIA